MVVDCEKDTLREHCYWPIVSDLINVLSHKPVAHTFLSDEKLLKFWFELVAYFQGVFQQNSWPYNLLFLLPDLNEPTRSVFGPVPKVPMAAYF